MRLTCPVCDYVEARAHRAWRLEICPRCRADGREVYLADSVAEPNAGRIRPRPLGRLASAASRVSPR